MKWLSKIIYIVIILVVGIIIVATAQTKKITTYYEEVGKPLLIDNKKEDFLSSYFLATNRVSSYINKPVYIASSLDEDIPFDLSIYNTKNASGEQYLYFYFDDRLPNTVDKSIKYEELGFIKSKENYDKGKAEYKLYTSIRLNLFLEDEAGNIDIVTKNYSIDADLRQPINALNVRDGKFYYQKLVNKKQVNKVAVKIRKMQLDIVDYSENQSITEELGVVHNLVTIESLVDFQHPISNLDVLVKESIITPDKREERFRSIGFDGYATSYDLNEVYSDDQFVNYIDKSVLNTYNYFITNWLIVYVIIILVVTYLMFFLKPTINYIDKKKYQKYLENKEKN